jgi:hypothetical protein
MNHTPIDPGVVVFGRPISFTRPMVRHSEAMRPQIRVERFLGELPEVGYQTQALELSLLIVASVVRIRHGVALPSREMSGRTSTLPLSVVQTTEPKP